MVTVGVVPPVILAAAQISVPATGAELFATETTLENEPEPVLRAMLETVIVPAGLNDTTIIVLPVVVLDVKAPATVEPLTVVPFFFCTTDIATLSKPHY